MHILKAPFWETVLFVLIAQAIALGIHYLLGFHGCG